MQNELRAKDDAFQKLLEEREELLRAKRTIIAERNITETEMQGGQR